MANVHKLVTKTARKNWAEKINKAHRETVDKILQTGKLLLEAKDELKHGEFERMIEGELDFSPRMARNLMQIAAHPSIGKRNPGSDLPANWTILGALSGLAEHDFEWARRRGLIKPDMSRGAARAIKKARESKDPTDLITNKDRLPRPSEAREIAHATGRLIEASDGRLYSGVTEEESQNHAEQRQRTYEIVDAINLIADYEVSPKDWAAQALEAPLYHFELGAIDHAIKWLERLKPLIAKQKKVINA